MKENENWKEWLKGLFHPDKNKAIIADTKQAYSIELKDGGLYLVYKGQIVIKKLENDQANENNIRLLNEAIVNQLAYEGIQYEI